ncbi:MAG: IclR family transcriptional regulator [Clostridiales bacterium]|jgi:DNA-binding IclR family transcriptional regulator|nr:IclR family transcriptional regulator [Clostridiales bacterium]
MQRNNKSDNTVAKEQAKPRSYAPQTFLKAIDILSCFTFEKPELTSSEISKMLKISPSTIYRYLAAMEQEDYLIRIENTNRYALGLSVVAISSVALCRSNIRLHGEPILKTLSEELGLSANLGVLFKGSVLHIAFSTFNEVDKLYSIVGRCSGLTCTAMGKVLLSSLSMSEVNSIVKKYGFAICTPNSINDLRRLEKELLLIQERKYAVDNEEKKIGVRCLAVPIRQQGGKIVAAMSVTSRDADRFNAEFDKMLRVLLDNADVFSSKLGYFRN